jgi:uncharacterized membrane protein YhaH (DUF805 family)
MNWYMEALRKYAEFSGRSRRKEFWMFTLINAVVIFAMAFASAFYKDNINPFGIILLVYILAIVIPSLALTIRRLHDIGRSGWWIFISLVPFIGSIVMLIFEVLPGEVGDNPYGPDPKIA